MWTGPATFYNQKCLSMSTGPYRFHHPNCPSMSTGPGAARASEADGASEAERESEAERASKRAVFPGFPELSATRTAIQCRTAPHHFHHQNCSSMLTGPTPFLKPVLRASAAERASEAGERAISTRIPFFGGGSSLLGFFLDCQPYYRFYSSRLVSFSSPPLLKLLALLQLPRDTGRRKWHRLHTHHQNCPSMLSGPTPLLQAKLPINVDRLHIIFTTRIAHLCRPARHRFYNQNAHQC